MCVLGLGRGDVLGRVGRVDRKRQCHSRGKFRAISDGGFYQPTLNCGPGAMLLHSSGSRGSEQQKA